MFIFTLAVLLGGGSLLLFGAFLFFGSLGVASFGWTETRSLAWDGLLSLLFFAQHSLMVRPSLQRLLSRLMPAHYHGALYAIASGLVLTIVVVFWQKTPTVVIALEGLWRWLLRAVLALAAAGMVWGAISLSHFDPLGLDSLRAHAPSRPVLVIRGPYRWVRHPLYFFSIVMVWAFPVLSTDRLLFNLLWTAWIYAATFWEESDLVALFGEPYRDYQRRVPRLLPLTAP